MVISALIIIIGIIIAVIFYEYPRLEKLCEDNNGNLSKTDLYCYIEYKGKHQRWYIPSENNRKCLDYCAGDSWEKLM